MCIRDRPYIAWKKQAQSKQKYTDVTIHTGQSQKYIMSQNDFNEPNGIEVSFVVPAYNEEKRLPKMLEETLNYLVKQAFKYEVIVVSDGSVDKTVQVALKYCNYKGQKIDLKVLEYKVNKGKGGAVRYGMMVAKGKYILMLDADAATQIDDFAKVYQKMQQTENNKVGIVIGTRHHYFKEIKAQRKWYRNILSYILKFILTVLSDVKVTDVNCGFKLFTSKSAKSIFNILHLQRWSFDVESFMIAYKLQTPIQEVPVNWQEIEGSKLNVVTDSIAMTRDIILVKLLYLFKIWRVSDKIFSFSDKKEN
eukprot:TRINITY_DN8284_c0_g1_i2.p1 TRINITY_DN8284_c0_g1~~TRINITY_DN8284_c0_g1_i2.p1  ORF type:complete len:307 (-),score=54.01 TRINITY_DN8284_c0_g1_i2:209-1129(-)